MKFLNTRIPCYISIVLFRSRHRPSRGRSKRNRGATRTGCGRIWPGFRDPRCKIRACSGFAGPMRASSGHQAVRRLGLIGKPSQPTHVACHGRHRDVGLGAGQSDGSGRRSHPSLPVGEAHKQACNNDSHPSDECFSGRTGAGGTFGAGEGRAAALHAARAARGSFPESADTAPKCSSMFQKRRCLDIPTFNSASPRESRPNAKRNGPSGASSLSHIVFYGYCCAPRQSIRSPRQKLQKNSPSLS